MYQGWRFFSHSGTCWTTGRAPRAAGSSSAPAAGRRRWCGTTSAPRPHDEELRDRGARRATKSSCERGARGEDRGRGIDQPWRTVLHLPEARRRGREARRRRRRGRKPIGGLRQARARAPPVRGVSADVSLRWDPRQVCRPPGAEPVPAIIRLRKRRPPARRVIPRSGDTSRGIPRSGVLSKPCAVPLSLEIALARTRGRRPLAARRPRRRHDAAREAALRSSTRRAIDRLAARLPQGAALVSATNGKTTTAAMAAEILAPARAARAQRSGANLISGVASTLLDARGRRARAVRGRRGRAARGRARACGRARSASATSSATSSTATASWSSSPSAGAAPSRGCRRTPTLVVNGDDPQVGDLAARRAPGRSSSASTTRAHARPALQHAADSKYCVALRDALRLRGGLRRPSRRLPLPDLRARAAAARRRRARDRARTASTRASFTLVTPGGRAPRAAARCRGSTTSTTRSPPPRSALALGASLDEVVAGLERFGAAFGRFERIDDRRPAAAHAADQEPGRRERGDPHAARRRRRPPSRWSR